MQNETSFNGQIGTTVTQSSPWWDPHPPRRPNVVLVILDDMGWSDLGCFGSEIATPAIDALAADGMRFNRFHVTPLCSPTRAALLSGQNHHAVGMRFLADTDTGFPNSRGSIRPDVPLLPKILGTHGYASYLVGKWHLAPLHEVTPAGPFRNWPLAKGFDRYYGFLDGCTDQYEPELYEDNHQIDVPPKDGYHLSEDLVDQAIGMLHDHTAFRTESPFFLQLAFGATHAPFQAPAEYIDKYRDTFAKGWDAVRAERLQRQIELGLVPEGTQLSERPEDVQPWDSLDADAQLVYSRLQAAFAGFLEHTDAQIGRLMAALADMELADDTIVLVLSDNGASREGGPHGDIDTNGPYSGLYREPSQHLDKLEGLGGPTTGVHYPEGWAMAGNTPFRYYKQFVDLGGVRSPLVMSWPAGVARPGSIADGFLHAVDIAPTLLDLLGIEGGEAMHGASASESVRGAAVQPGRSTQYWETMGHRAIIDGDWKAVSRHDTGAPYEEDRWRLYNVREDFSESHDLADEQPERLVALQQLWWEEASRFDVFPLDDRPLRGLIADRGPIGLFARERVVLRPGHSHVPFASAITGSNRHVVIQGHLRHDGVRDGVLLSSGNAQGGYLLYLADGQLVLEHKHLDDHMVIAGDAVGATLVEAVLDPEEDGSASVRLLVNGAPVAEGTIPSVGGHLSFWGMDVGRVARSTFSHRIVPPFELDGTSLDRVEITVFPGSDDLRAYADAVMASE